MILLKDDALLTTGIPVSCDKLALEIHKCRYVSPCPWHCSPHQKHPLLLPVACIAIKYQSSATVHKSRKHKHRVHLENITNTDWHQVGLRGRIVRMQEPTGGRLAYPLCQLFNTLVKFIKYYHIISVNPVQNIWVGKVAIQNYNGTIQGHIIHLCLNWVTFFKGVKCGIQCV